MEASFSKNDATPVTGTNRVQRRLKLLENNGGNSAAGRNNPSPATAGKG
jgi:hypothetical protein